jgi:7-cyano-7-deazaguanine synthase
VTDTYVMLSGGPDSTSLAHWLKVQESRDVAGIHVHYGQPGGEAERDTADRVAQALGISLKVLSITGLWEAFSDVAGDNRALMGNQCRDILVPIPVAANWVAWAGVKRLALGVNRSDVRAMPWVPALMKQYRSMLPLPGHEFEGFELLFPFLNMSKAEVFRRGQQVGAPLMQTWSCVEAGSTQCGVCSACRARRSAFAEAAIEDTTRYRRG